MKMNVQASTGMLTLMKINIQALTETGKREKVKETGLPMHKG
jgi:hypothetical protein